MKAIAIIQDEHRAITAVVEGLRHLVAEIGAGRMAAGPRSCSARCSTTSSSFPERLHHPKEDDYLFARLRARRPDAAPLLDELDARARDRPRALRRAEGAVGALPRRSRGASRRSPTASSAMRTSTGGTCARRRTRCCRSPRQALTAEDWDAIDAAFASNDDPVVGVPASKAFRELFRRIVAIVPPPFGVGPEPSARN